MLFNLLLKKLLKISIEKLSVKEENILVIKADELDSSLIRAVENIVDKKNLFCLVMKKDLEISKMEVNELKKFIKKIEDKKRKKRANI